MEQKLLGLRCFLVGIFLVTTFLLEVLLWVRANLGLAFWNRRKLRSFETFWDFFCPVWTITTTVKILKLDTNILWQYLAVVSSVWLVSISFLVLPQVQILQFEKEIACECSTHFEIACWVSVQEHLKVFESGEKFKSTRKMFQCECFLLGSQLKMSSKWCRQQWLKFRCAIDHYRRKW